MNPKILLIEDDASTAASLKKVLCTEGYVVEMTGRGDAGLELATQNEYGVVISDLRLPGLGGLELVARLHAAKPKQPIILMTAHGTTETGQLQPSHHAEDMGARLGELSSFKVEINATGVPK